MIINGFYRFLTVREPITIRLSEKKSNAKRRVVLLWLIIITM